MKSLKNATMGLEINLSVPETNEEFDQLAGRKNAACEDAVKYNVLHAWNSTFRSKFVDAVEKETGVAIKIDEEKTKKQPLKKDGTQTPVYEKDLLYFKRAMIETGRQPASFFTLAQTVADSIKLDLSESSAGSGRLAGAYITAANDLFTKETSTPGTLAKVVANLERLNPGYKVELDSETNLPTPETLAKAIKVNEERKSAESLEELVA